MHKLFAERYSYDLWSKVNHIWKGEKGQKRVIKMREKKYAIDWWTYKVIVALLQIKNLYSDNLI